MVKVVTFRCSSKPHRRIGWVAAAVLAWCAAGCSETPNEYEMVPVQGLVLLDGKPVANAKVMFHSETTPRALATTDSSGAFSLTTPRYGEGVAKGDYLVQIHSDEATAESSSGKSVNLPIVYSESGVKVVTVSPSGEKNFTFELKSRPRNGDYLTNNPFAEP